MYAHSGRSNSVCETNTQAPCTACLLHGLRHVTTDLLCDLVCMDGMVFDMHPLMSAVDIFELLYFASFFGVFYQLSTCWGRCCQVAVANEAPLGGTRKVYEPK